MTRMVDIKAHQILFDDDDDDDEDEVERERERERDSF